MKVNCKNTICRFKTKDDQCAKEEITLEVPGHYENEESPTLDCVDFEFVDSEE